MHREEGEAIPAGNPTILTIVQLDPLRARFSVSVEQATRFKVDETVTLTFAGTRQQASAKVEAIAPVTDAESGTVWVTLTIDNSQGLYRSGMRCILEVPSDPSTPGTEDLWEPLPKFKPPS